MVIRSKLNFNQLYLNFSCFYFGINWIRQSIYWHCSRYHDTTQIHIAYFFEFYWVNSTFLILHIWLKSYGFFHYKKLLLLFEPKNGWSSIGLLRRIVWHFRIFATNFWTYTAFKTEFFLDERIHASVCHTNRYESHKIFVSVRIKYCTHLFNRWLCSYFVQWLVKL